MENTTENCLAAAALEAALKRIKEPCFVCIYTECACLFQALRNGWPEEWRHRGWKTKNGKPVANAEIWQSVTVLLNAHKIRVYLREPHAYRHWMSGTLSRGEMRTEPLRGVNIDYAD